MTNIKTLTIRFANQLERHEIPLFRGAIIATIGRGNDVLLHNHVGVGFRYAYPEIQYKTLDGNIKFIFKDRKDCEKAVLEFPKTVMGMPPGITISQAVVAMYGQYYFIVLINDYSYEQKD